MGATLIVDDAAFILVLSGTHLPFRKDGRFSWPSSARRQGDLFVCMISTGNQAQVARMVALWFAHYAAAPL